MAGKNRSSGMRLALEPLERRDFLTAGGASGFSGAAFLASALAGRDAHARKPADASAPAAQPLITTLSASLSANQPPAGADATVTTLEDTTYRFTTADFGFSDPDQLWVPSGAASPSGLTAGNVLVLYNSASAAGAEIAQYYAQIHPGVRLVGIVGIDPNREDISADDYLSIIRPQVMTALTSATDVIVTTKGLPLRITVTETALPLFSTYVDPSGTSRPIYSWKPYSSLESELASVDRISTWQMMGDQSYIIGGHFTLNPYYSKDATFRHDNFGTRLTARLDGYTVADVKAALDRAQQASIGPSNHPDGPLYFLVDNDPTKSYSGYMEMLPNNVLIPRGLPVVYDNTTAFVGTAPGPVIGYDSHGVRQASTPASYLLNGLDVALAPGAVFTSWESYNAYSFDPASTQHANQGQVAQWLQIGGSAGVGHVQEPTASRNSVTNEDQMFEMLLAGYTFAEAAWSANCQLSFVNTVVGDPLMRWQSLASGQNAFAAVKIAALPTAGALTLGGVAVVSGQLISAADIMDGRLAFTPAAGAFGLNYASFAFQVQDDGGTSGGGSDLDPSPNTITVNVTAVEKGRVLARNLFYNQSGTALPLRYDGNNSAIDANDDHAIAIDKAAYLPGSGAATFANVSSYSKGINGIMVDLGGAGAHASITAADFIFRVGNNNAPNTWTAAPPPSTVSVRAGAGAGGSDRVELIWNNGDIFDEWLQVVTLGNGNTGLPQLTGYTAGYGDVFYYGNVPADTGLGDTETLALVNATDEVAIRNNSASVLSNIPITNLYDVNHDGAVNATDQMAARNNASGLSNALKFLNIGAGSSPNAPEGDGGNTGISANAFVAAGSDGAVASAFASPSVSSGSVCKGPANALADAVMECLATQAMQQFVGEDTPLRGLEFENDELESLLDALRLA